MANLLRLGRETQDIDFAIERLSNEIRVLQKVFDEIVKIEVGDGFVFANPKIAPLEHFHMQYQGAQVAMEVHFGKARFPLCIDLGFGDVVSATERNILLISSAKGPLFESSVTLKCYPMEFVFAEKLETMIHRGADNSRMKDFHDLFTLVRTENALNGLEVDHAIRAVFAHRGSSLRLPIQFDIPQLVKLQSYWERYHQTVTSPGGLPDQVSQVIDTINEWLGQEVSLR